MKNLTSPHRLESALATRFGGRLMEHKLGGHWSAESAANSLGVAGSASRFIRRVPLTWVGGDPQPVFRIEIRPAPVFARERGTRRLICWRVV